LNIPTALLQRIPGPARPELHFELDGQACSGWQGDTVLTALLTRTTRLRRSEPSATPRAGLCMMGACQDCWVSTADGRRLRACTTMLEAGMQLCSGPAE
jgi:predicted molibdopterin-dependent oxidoreductase YjgC